jgi:WD40 repeat protein
VLSLAQNSPLDYWEWTVEEKIPKRLEIAGHPDHLAWVAGGLALAGQDRLVRIQATHDETLLTMYGQPDAISALAVGPSADLIATGSYDGTVCLWNLGCGTWTRRFLASPR